MHHLTRSILLAICALCGIGTAHASWLDSDFYCRVHGCVVVHDGISFDVYDNYDFATGTTIGPGARMIPWSGNPFQGIGGVNPVITGTLTEGLYGVPLVDQSSILGIDEDGDGFADRLPVDFNGSGFLDAGDSLDPFSLNMSTDLVSTTSSAQRSFYLSSRTDFYLTAEVSIVGPLDALNSPQQISNVSFTYALTRNGTDDGMSFGANARRGNQFRDIGNVTTLGDIYGCLLYTSDAADD